jgi:cytochrome P450
MSTALPDRVEFDGFEPSVHADPYPSYQRVRSAGAFVPFLLDDVPVQLVTRYDECAAILASPDWGHGYAAGISPFRDTVAAIPGSFVRMDPPEHARLRSLVNRVFTPRAASGYAATIDTLVDGLMAKAAAAGHLDVLADLAVPLALAMIPVRLLGAPAEDGEMLRGWQLAIAHGSDPDYLLSEGDIARRGEAARSVMAYFADIAARRGNGEREQDLLDVLLLARDRGALTGPEVIGICLLTLVAGMETSVNLIGNGMLALLRHPEQLARLRAQPELVSSATDEMLRYDPPTQFTIRVALTDTVVGGREFRRGDGVVILTASASRDEAVFDAADQFDITRYHGPHPARRHLGFSLGLHYCVGAPLARLEAHAAIGQLVRRTRDLTLAVDQPGYQPSLIHRGLLSLPVDVTL